MTRVSRLLLGATAWLAPAVLTATPAPARAAYLTFVEVQRDNQNGVDGLQGIEGVAVSPDGRHVYASSDTESALAIFSRSPTTGALTFLQVKKDGVGGVDGLQDAQTVSLSPDGLFVYVAGRLDNAIAVFRRDPAAGTVTFVQAVKNGAAGVSGLVGPKHVIVSPDGADAYAAGHDDNSLVALRRDQTTGKLTFLQKQTDGVAGVDGLAEVRALAISPDGTTVYAASKLDDAVSVFRRDPATGLLTFIQVLKDGVAGADGLAKTRSVSVSPDGDNVYSTGGDDDAVAVFHRDQATGLLTVLQVMHDGVGGVDGLNGAQWVTVSPDGTHVLATGETDDAVAVFARDPGTGRLTFVEVHRDNVNGVDGMNAPQPVAFSPDGSTAYVGGHSDNALAVFHLACGDGVLDAGEQCDDGNMLNGDCCSSTCHFEVAGTSCPDDGNACTDDLCNATGNCAHPDNTAPCDDGAFCTVDDTCRNGLCQGATRDCSGVATGQCQTGACDEATDRCVARAGADGTTCNDGNDCTQSDSCHAGTCVGTNKPNGSVCNDGNACTQADTCQAGMCTGANPVVCAAPDQCHTAGTCNPVTGMCSNPVKPDGATCDDANACTQPDACRAGTCVGTNKPNGAICNDGNACTQADVCQAGACVGDNPVSCTAQDQCHTAGTCNPVTGMCSNPAKPDGATCDDANACTQSDSCRAGTCMGTAKPDGSACNDANPCTQADTCRAGTCTGGNPVVCAAPDQCHDAGICNPLTGACSNPAKPDGTTCDDGNACTQADTCRAGTCTGGNPVVCAAPDQCHDAGTCNPVTGVCLNPVKPDGATCDDGNDCTQGDSCQASTCTGITKPDGSPCNDGDTCTRTDTCQAGTCTGRNPVVCPTPDQCHTAGTCDPATGMCSTPPRPDGTSCDDANPCTDMDSCRAGICTGAARPDGIACNDGDGCTRIDSCQTGRCVGADPVVCTAPDQCHEAGTCNPATGACSIPARPDGARCDDANPCTDADACHAGVCAGTTKPDGTTCNDGNFCTQADTCQAGACGGGIPVVCNPQDQCHDAGSCDPGTGACSNPAKTDGITCDDGNECTQLDACHAGTCTGTARPDGSACNDANACTQADTCQAGTCTGGNPVVCAAPDQCHDAGTCNPVTGTCSNPAKPDGATCNDANACTRTDTCQAGACVGGNPLICTAPDQCHSAGTCDPATGSCSSSAKPSGATCDDGNACTQADTCQAGTCTGGNPVVCAAPDQCHDAGTCNPVTGMCSNPAKPDGATCDDANACTQSDSCRAGACMGTARPDGSACNDANACTQADTCQAGTCTGGNPVVCAAPDQCHDTGICNPVTGACSNPAKPDGATCDDANACTQADTCQAGTCAGGNPVVCAAPDQCHDAGTCNPVTGVCSNPVKPDGATCDDANACTQADTCQAGTCTGGNPVVCAALDQCHDAGTCNPLTGMCSNPETADGTRCDDGNACTQYDACAAGSCTGSDPVVCAARDQCHDAGTCDHLTGLCSDPVKTDGATCDDGNACTRSDACEAGACAGTDPVLCPAADPCHGPGTCDPSTGGCSSPAKPDGTTCDDGNPCTDADACTAGLCSGPARSDGSTCDDGNGCTQTDTCQAGFCVGANPMVCAARDACHLAAAACDPAAGTCPDLLAPDGTPCDDGNPCSELDSCHAGVCTAGRSISCPAADPCHAAGVCDAATGRCVNPAKPDGTSCDDGDACTDGDQCVAGACTGGVMPDRDGDGICDLVDVCPDIPNPDQLDTDHNGVGDVCECTQPAPGRCIGGGGSRKLDCMLEFNTTGPVTYNRKHTRVKRILRCTDGDPACDLDRTPDGTCTFGVSACLSNRDPRFPRCHMSGPLAFEVITPKTTSKNKLDMMNMWALEEMLRATGLEIRRHDALFTPGQVVGTPDLCSPLIHLMVPAPASHSARPIRRRFRVRTTVPARTRDRDRFVLECSR